MEEEEEEEEEEEDEEEEDAVFSVRAGAEGRVREAALVMGSVTAFRGCRAPPLA